jgi:hypothetical protein
MYLRHREYPGNAAQHVCLSVEATLSRPRLDCHAGRPHSFGQHVRLKSESAAIEEPSQCQIEETIRIGEFPLDENMNYGGALISSRCLGQQYYKFSAKRASFCLPQCFTTPQHISDISQRDRIGRHVIPDISKTTSTVR